MNSIILAWLISQQSHSLKLRKLKGSWGHILCLRKLSNYVVANLHIISENDIVFSKKRRKNINHLLLA